MAYTIPTPNQSVSGAVTAPPGSVMAVSGSFTTANQSVSGTVVATQLPGSILATSATITPVANQSVSGTVNALQLAGSILAVNVTPAANQSVSGTVGASIIGLPYFAIAGSVATVGTAVANQSVSGAVSISNLPTTQNVSGSVVAFLGGSTNASVITVGTAVANQSVSGAVSISNFPAAQVVAPNNSSLYSLQPAGSVLAVSATLTPTANQSVSGTIDIGVNSGSVVAFQGTPQWTVKSSLAGGIFPISGSVAAVVTNFPTTQNVSGSVAAWLQSTNASVITVGTAAANQSVSGAVTTQAGSILSVTNPAGSVTTVIATHPAGSITSVTTPAGSTMAVLATQVTSPWIVAPNNSSLFALQVAGSILAVSGSFTTANQSVSGAVQVDNTVTVKSSLAGGIFPISGSVAVGNFPATQVVAPNNSSLFSIQPAGSVLNVNISGSVATVGTSANQSVSGTVQVDNTVTVKSSLAGGIFPISGSVAAVVTNTVTVVSSISGGIFPISGSVGAVVTNFPANQSVSGTITANQGTNPWVTVGSVQGTMSVLGTVPVTQATSPWVTAPNNSSLYSLQPAGSILATADITGASIVGTYVEDAAYATGAKGIFTLSMRNDTMSSVTSADGDYSGMIVGPIGEMIVANAPITKWVRGTASMLGGLPTTGVLVPLIAAQGASVFTYITGMQVTNPSANNVYVTFLSAGTPIGYTTAPATGGSNIVLPNALKTTDNVAFNASVSGVASVYLAVQGFISKT